MRAQQRSSQGERDPAPLHELEPGGPWSARVPKRRAALREAVEDIEAVSIICTIYRSIL